MKFRTNKAYFWIWKFTRKSGKLDSRIHQKPNNQHLYIPPFSFHNPKMFESMIIAELTRYIQIIKILLILKVITTIDY